MKQITFFQPFKYRDFRLLILAESVYRSSLWMLCMAVGLMMKEIHPNSTFYQGVIGFLYNAALLVVPFFSGVLADRFQRKYLIAAIQIWYIIPCIMMLVIGFYFHITDITIMVFCFIIGLGFSICSPALRAIIADVIPNQKDLGAGMSVFSSSIRITQFIGYAIGGIIYVNFGAMACFIFAIFCLTASFFIIMAMKPSTNYLKHKNKSNSSSWQDFQIGFSYFWKSLPIRTVVILSALNGLLLFPYVFQMPILNANTLHGTPHTLAILMVAGGIGGTLGGLWITFRTSHLYTTRFIATGMLIVILSFLAFSFAKNYLTALPCVFMLDFGMVLFTVSCAIFIQQLCNDEIRGRVMGFYLISASGTIPLGSLFYYGLLGEVISTPHLFQLGAAIFFVSLLLFLFKLKKLRKESLATYLEKGIIERKAEFYKI